MMNGGIYEESPPPAPPPQQQTPAPTPISSSGGVTSPGSATAPPSVTSASAAPSQTPATTSSGGSSTSPSASSVASNNNTGPLHIPAKRLTAYGECPSVEPGGGVIRHSHHGTQPWNYSPVENHHTATAFEPAGGLNHHQYSNAPTYYNLAAEPSGGRDGRKAAAALSFWSPAATAAGGGGGASTGGGGTPGTTTTGAAGEYAKYSTTGSVSSAGGPSSDPAVSSSCHQSFSAAAAQSWCNYSPYSSAAAAAATRHHHHVVDTHHHPHHTQPVPYLNPTDEGRRVAAAAAMVAAESAGFPHDGYGLRNYAPEPVPSTPYAPPGAHGPAVAVPETKLGKRRGRCKWFNVAKGWGFITPDDGGQDVFVHQSVIQMSGFRSLGDDEEVEFECKVSDKGLEATSVTGPEGADCSGSHRRPVSKKRFRRIRCYNCGEFANHIAAKCTMGPQPKRCHHCKSQDHLIAECPARPERNKKSVASFSGEMELESQEQVTGEVLPHVTEAGE